MNVSLTPELERIVSFKVESGLYNSASEVVREGLRLLQQRDEVRELKLNALRTDIQKGIDDLENGRFTDGGEVMAGFKERLLTVKKTMGKYVVTREAEHDIDEILIYIAADNIEAALSFNDRLTDLFEMLAENPKAGRERPELKEDLRSIPEGNYLIFYRKWAGKIGIVRVLHGARDLDEIFS